MNSILTTRIAWSACALLLLAGCATREPPSELLAARQAVAVAGQDADAAKAGAVQLQEARKSLDDAEKAFAEHDEASVVREHAYSASRNADVARQQGAEERARQAIAAGEAERNRVLLEARTQEVEKAKDEASAARSDAEQLAVAMAEMQARETERGMVVTLGDVLFDTNQAVVRADARPGLERISAFLAGNPGFRAIVEGHTDSRGSDEYNRDLSERRADAVRAVITRGGNATDRVRATGLGEAYPVASNDTAAGQQENRRVEIVFSDANGAFAAGGERL